MKWSAVCLVFVPLLLVGFVTSCGNGDGDGGTQYACSYQKRSSQTCNHYDWGAWQSGCITFNSNDLTVSPQQYCDNLTTGGTYCAAGCCIDTQYQNKNLRQGTC